MEGVLENKINLKPVKHNYCKKYADIPWIVASCDLLEVEWKNDTYLEAMEGGFEWNFDDKIDVDTTERSSECSSEALFQLFWVSS
jgi:hypothetical protein